MDTAPNRKRLNNEVLSEYSSNSSAQEVIDYTDATLYEEDGYLQQSLDKDFFTPEEVYELVMSDVKSIYDLKNAV